MQPDPQRPDNAGVIAPPPLIFLAAVLVGAGLDHALPPATLFPPEPRALAGGGLIGLGVALILWAALALARARTAIEPWRPTTAIVASGPYRFTRNPIYLGMALAHAGIAIALGGAWTFASLVVALVTIQYGVIAREERYLEAKFGAGYRAYKARVRRWL